LRRHKLFKEQDYLNLTKFFSIHPNPKGLGYSADFYIKDVKGNMFSIGKKVYDDLCKRDDMNSDFREKFCDGEMVKRKLWKSNKNDMRLVGSAILLGEKEIITNNLKDIKPIEKVTDIKVR
jgi:hypothetical protein